MSHHRRTLSATAVFVVVLMAGCAGTGSGSVEVASSEAPESSPSGDAPSDAASGVTPTIKQFELYTHCGVEHTRIQGVWWHAKPPLYNKRRSGPPVGWGDPFQKGTLTIVSDDRAIFEAMGRQVVFVPSSDNQPVRICD